MKISFVVPSFNTQTWLPHAISSITGIPGTKECPEQTYKDYEIIVINDGSTDKTEQYLNWLKNNPKVKVLKTKGLGRSEARNLGNESATGSIICVLDADDIAAPNRAALTVKKIQEGFDFVYGSASVIDAAGRKINEIRADTFNIGTALKEPFHNNIVHSTVAYTKAFAMRFPYQSGEIARLGLDDWAQQITAADAGIKMDFIPQTISAYRVLESGISNKRDPKEVLTAKKAYLETLTGLVRTRTLTANAALQVSR